MTNYPTLRSANEARQKEWDPGDNITLAYRGNELAGEVGEACNIIKKLERERIGIRGSRATKEQLAEELADVVICADLIAMHEGIDLDPAVQAKFNATSEKLGLATRYRLDVPDDIRETVRKLYEPYSYLVDGPSEDDVVALLVAERARWQASFDAELNAMSQRFRAVNVDRAAKMMSDAPMEKLRLWIWEQLDRNGEDLIAIRPTFDLILNKIDEFRDAAPAPTVSEPKIRPMETLDEAGRLIARAHVHEDCAIVLYGTNDKPIGWIDTHAWLKGRVYRDHLDPSPTVSGEPVAWLRVRDDGRQTFWERNVDGACTPLYTHPSPTRAEVLDKAKIANILRNFHRNSCYPEADDGDIDAAIAAIRRALKEEKP